MQHPLFQKYSHTKKPVERFGLLFMASAMLIGVVGITVVQDILEAVRRGYAFHFSESLLFKTIWFLFIPILIVLYKKLQSDQLDTFYKTALYIFVPISIHFVALLFVFLCLSMVFYDGRYDLYKIASYTLANDLYKLIFIYTAFVLGYKYYKTITYKPIHTNQKTALESILICNGKETKIIKVNTIYTITAATPYIAIELESKKYLHTETLKSITEQLDNNQFVRVHKSAIVNMDKIVSFKSRLNGDYDLVLKNGNLIRLSRTYATHFKSLFHSTHRVTP